MRLESQHAVAPGTIELRVSPWRTALMIVLCAGFVVGGWFMAHDPEGDASTHFWGWFVLVFFGLGIPFGILNLLRRGPRLVLSYAGLEDRTNRIGLIPWSEIQQFELRDINGQKFLMLQMLDAEAWNAKIPGSRSKAFLEVLGLRGIPVHVSGLTMGANDIVAEVHRRLLEQRKTAGG